MSNRITLTLTSAALLILTVGCMETNWEQFRGPGYNMVAEVNMDLPESWSTNENIRWEFPLSGHGWSSPVVWGDRVFISEVILDSSTVKPDTNTSRRRRGPGYPMDAVYSWMVYAIDLNTGKLLWEDKVREGHPRIPIHRDNTYASETQVTDGKRIYTYFGMTGLYCHDLEGNLQWEKDLGVYKTQSDWGCSTSPVLHKKSIFMQIDNEEESFLIALNKISGEELWKVSREEKTNYSTGIIWEHKQGTELVTTGQTKARSYDPETGDLIWELELGGGRSIPSPVAGKDLIYVGNEYRRGKGGTLFAVKAGSRGDITPAPEDSVSAGVLWARPDAGLSMPSPVLYKGYLYLVDRRPGAIHCYDAMTGRIIYNKVRIPGAAPFWSSPWAYDERIFCLDEKGTTHIINTGEEFKVLSANTIPGRFWATAALTDGCVILRGVSGLYCLAREN